MTVSQISVFLENRPGMLAAFTDVLSAHQVDMRALSLVETVEFGILRIIVSDPEAVIEIIREAGFICQMTQMIALCISDKPGAFSDAVKVLGNAGINLEYCYAVTARQEGNAYMMLRTADTAAAEKLLTEAGFTLCGADAL